MAADTADSLQKVDSLVDEGKDKAPAKRRQSSLRADVFNMADLGEYLCPHANCLWWIVSEGLRG